MSDPLLPVPPGETGETEADVEDAGRPDVLSGAPDPDEDAEPEERDAVFRTPVPGDRLDASRLGEDLDEQDNSIGTAGS